MLIAKRNAMSGNKLPYARRLAYLESTARQWLDTKIVPTKTMSCRCVASLVKSNGATSIILGRVGLSTGANPTRWWVGIYMDKYAIFALNVYIPIGMHPSISKPNDFNIFELDSSSGICKVNGEQVYQMAPYTVDGDRSTTLTMFSSFYNGSLNGNGYVRVSSVEIFDNGKKIFHCIPVMSYEGNPEMFDMVSGTFVERHGAFLYGELNGGGGINV